MGILWNLQILTTIVYTGISFIFHEFKTLYNGEYVIYHRYNYYNVRECRSDIYYYTISNNSAVHFHVTVQKKFNKYKIENIKAACIYLDRSTNLGLIYLLTTSLIGLLNSVTNIANNGNILYNRRRRQL